MTPADSINSEWATKKLLIKWLFDNGRCAICGDKIPLEVHHNKYPTRGGCERPEDLLPLCSFCHPMITFMHDGGSAMFKAWVRKLIKRTQRVRLEEGRIRVRLEQVRDFFLEQCQWSSDALDEIRSAFDQFEFVFGQAQARLAETENHLGAFQAMQDSWEKEQSYRLKTGRDLLRQREDGEQRRAA